MKWLLSLFLFALAICSFNIPGTVANTEDGKNLYAIKKDRRKRGELRERAMKTLSNRRLQGSGDPNEHVFDNIAALNAAITTAQYGDVFTLLSNANNINQYINAKISVSCHGVTLIAETSGDVVLTGSIKIEVRGHNNSLSGFRFRGGFAAGSTQKSVISLIGDDNYIEEMDFTGYDAPHYVTLVAGSQFNEVAYNNFEMKPVTSVRGALVLVETSGSRPGRHIVHSNSFHNIPGTRGNFGNIPLQLGGNGNTANILDSTLVENNYFNNTGGGDAQTISVQSTGNIIRYNTFTNIQDAMLTFRSGRNNIADCNFFIRAGG